MARRRTYEPLRVYLNNRLVGFLNKETSGAIDFWYDQSWLDWEHALPISLSLPLRETPFRGEPVIAVFDNLLPDSDGGGQNRVVDPGCQGSPGGQGEDESRAGHEPPVVSDGPT